MIEFQIVDKLPVKETDVPIDIIISENEVIMAP
jgi:5-formyltetrahydrofolate cyclo-ligase